MYRDNTRCPTCGAQVSPNDRCLGCAGVWLEQSRFLSMWAAMGGREDRLVAHPRTGGRPARPCAGCFEPMQRVEVLAIPLDLCPEHGWWFDVNELETLLAAGGIDRKAWFEMFEQQIAGMR